MPKLTNIAGLPDPLVRAVTWSNRDTEGCDYTITGLIRPPRIAALEALHDEQIEEDAADRLWALMGSAGHEILRRSAKAGIVEERAIVEVEVNGRIFKVGGQLDYAVSDDTLWDFKLCSVWVTKDGAKDEWVQQLSAYRWLAMHYGVHFQRAAICAIFRDWSKREAARNREYPQTQAQVFPIPLWDHLDTENWIKNRIALHEAAKVNLPECSQDDVWAKPTTYAVTKRGNKRAFRVFESAVEAQHCQIAQGPGFEVQTRPGERPRCESYCRVAQFCQQWQEWKAANKPPEPEPAAA